MLSKPSASTLNDELLVSASFAHSSRIFPTDSAPTPANRSVYTDRGDSVVPSSSLTLYLWSWVNSPFFLRVRLMKRITLFSVVCAIWCALTRLIWSCDPFKSQYPFFLHGWVDCMGAAAFRQQILFMHLLLITLSIAVDNTFTMLDNWHLLFTTAFLSTCHEPLINRVFSPKGGGYFTFPIPPSETAVTSFLIRPSSERRGKAHFPANEKVATQHGSFAMPFFTLFFFDWSLLFITRYLPAVKAYCSSRFLQLTPTWALISTGKIEIEVPEASLSR